MRERTGRFPGSRRIGSPFPAPRRQWVVHEADLTRRTDTRTSGASTGPLTVAGPRRIHTGFLLPGPFNSIELSTETLPRSRRFAQVGEGHDRS